MTQNRYFNCVTRSRAVLEWDPRDPPVAGSWPNAGYFGRAFAAMEPLLRDGGLTFYLTFDVERLPSYGPEVVAVVLDNEPARIPAYTGRVKAVFNNFGTRPQLGCSPFLEPSKVNLASLGMFARHGARWLPSATAHARSRVAASLGRGRAGVVRDIPVGTLNQVDLPLKPFDERRSALVFAGSVNHRPKPGAAIKARVTPKGLSRASMLRNVETLTARHPEVVADIHLTGAFVKSIKEDANEYSRRLMDAKISLVPRGAVAISARFLESLRAGCIVVTDHMAREWFYSAAPAVRLRDWHELEDVVPRLLADEPRMLALHEQGLAWWRRNCSEEAVGLYMAAMLNACR